MNEDENNCKTVSLWPNKICYSVFPFSQITTRLKSRGEKTAAGFGKLVLLTSLYKYALKLHAQSMNHTSNKSTLYIYNIYWYNNLKDILKELFTQKLAENVTSGHPKI